ncbi:MAG: leucine-rich repeat domain-containing protein, partial [Lentimicrobiaceae bacterium]|nr:leucine-rich repeat domain-containing protein [Lentimicrobiaceae bacterium]
MTKTKILFAALAFASLSVNIFAQSGTCGDGVNWAITGTAPNQTLTISYAGSGTGAMTDYRVGTAPWYPQRANLTTLVIGNGVTTIGNYTFFWCQGFTGSLTIPNSVTTIGANAFYWCDGFTGTLTLGNSVTTIGSQAFFNCDGFTGSLTIPNSVTTIESFTFANCYGFTGSLTIGNSVETIVSNAFQNCYGFKGSLTIGNSVETIGDGAFYNCSGLQGIVSLATVPPALGANVFYYVPTTIPVTVSSSSASCSYQSASGWSSFSNYSPDCEYAVQWGSTTLTYNGYPQAPTATFTNSLGQRVAVSVSGAETNTGSG